MGLYINQIVQLTHLVAISNGIKAIQIAKQIGTSKTKVNQFLHKKKSILFEQDANFLWYMVDIPDLTQKVDRCNKVYADQYPDAQPATFPVVAPRILW